MLGTALANNLIGLIIVAILGAYFYYSASVEEKNLTATFPTAYPLPSPARRCSSPSSFSQGTLAFCNANTDSAARYQFAQHR